MKRRSLLRSSLVAGGAWLLGPALQAQTPTPPPRSPQADKPPTQPTGFPLWLRFAPDGRLTVQTFVVEMGQGTHTAVRMLAAEELDLPLDAVSVEQAPVSPTYASQRIKNYASYGSIGLRLSLRELAPLCAAARDMLVRAAAARWQVAPEACRTEAGAVLHGPQRLSYAELLHDAAQLRPAAGLPPRPSAQWKLMGRDTPRSDIPAKLDGSAVFGIDVRRPGQLYAALQHAPRFGAELLKVNDAPARKLKGVRKVVRLKHSLAVVADSHWTAAQALAALKPQWSAGPHAHTDSEALSQQLRAAAQAGAGVLMDPRDDPRTDAAATAQAFADAAQQLDLLFEVPFLAHAPMEPMNAVALVEAQRAQLWLSTQSAQDTQHGVAKLLGFKPEQVVVHPQLLGGGFGRRLEHDFALEAAAIAKELPGVPVQMIWSRETDLRAGYYRPAVAARVRLALGADGLPKALSLDSANPSLLQHSGLTNGPPSLDYDWTIGMGWARHDYDWGPLRASWVKVDPGVPCGYWRSVGASQNVFFCECTVDQAAKLAGQDPLAYRLRLLHKAPKRQALLQALADLAGWSKPLPPGHFRGLAFSAGNAARSAHVVHISVPRPGQFRIERLWAAADVGAVVNPQAAQAQLMGGTLFGLSAALAGEITLKAGQVQQSNFHDYPLVNLAGTPPIELLVIGSHTDGALPIGIGEEGVASVAPALANALFAASGQAVSQLPLTRAGWERIG